VALNPLSHSGVRTIIADGSSKVELTQISPTRYQNKLNRQNNFFAAASSF